MKRLSTLSLLALSAMAITAFVGASMASANVAGKFTYTGGAGKKIETVKIKQHIFTVTGSQVKCNKVEFTGESTGTEQTSQTVTPVYKECEAFGFAATVEPGNCDFKLTATTDKINGHAETHLECASGGITIKVDNLFAKCTAIVPPQTVGGIHYVNTTVPEDVHVQITSSNIADEVTVSSGFCPLTVGKHSNATYTGEETVSAPGGVQFDE